MLKVIDDGATKYINLYDFSIVSLTGTTRVNVTGPLYLNSGIVYEYYEPGLVYLGERLQYKETDFTVALRASIRDDIYGVPGNKRNNDDFTRFMLKVYLAMNPEVRDSFEANYNYFFYDKAGIFVKGYWSVYTLGVARKNRI